MINSRHQLKPSPRTAPSSVSNEISTWHTLASLDDLPKDLSVAQVHTLLFSQEGYLMLREKNNKPLITTGGHVEPSDDNPVSALIREVNEELNCDLDPATILPLGYYHVTHTSAPGYRHWHDKTPFARLRFVAKISKINPARPDPAQPQLHIFGRKLIDPRKVLALYDDDYLNYASLLLPLAIQTAISHHLIAATSHLADDPFDALPVLDPPSLVINQETITKNKEKSLL